MKKEEYFKIGMIGALLILTVVVFVDVFGSIPKLVGFRVSCV